ncbi:MAG: hypothetical protein KA196_01885 [Arenimonas sp.]|nr:hypothetical protein [Arenimonas sp.]
MNRPFQNELPRALAEAVAALPEAPDAAVDAAQLRLTARLARAAPAKGPLARRWLAVAASAAAALVLVVALPLVSGRSDAFAAAQQHLRSFQRLAMDVTQRYNGDIVQTSRTVVDAKGVLRTDVGTQLSVIVDPPKGRVLTLLHEPREAMLVAFAPAPGAPADPLQWLQDVRDFQGQATALAETRIIDGQAARGWRLDVRGNAMELWTDRDGLPLSLRMQAGAGLQIDYRFEFEPDVPEGVLSSAIPAGYTQVTPDAD